MSDRVTAFRQLHANPEPLRLPNAWDAGSARLFESLSATAIATTSAGQAWALGYPDGYKLPTDVVLGLAANMRRVVKVPLSVDIVAGATLPLNVMAWKGLASAPALGKLGVHRLSAGSGIAQMLWAHAEALGKEFLANGRSQPFDEGPKPYPQIQALFA